MDKEKLNNAAEECLNNFLRLFDASAPYDNRLTNAIKAAFKAGAEWQAEHTPLPEDTVLFNKGVEEGKRLMMEEAVEGEVVQDLKGVNRVKSFSKIPEGLHFGDKVRIIILPKED